MERASLIFLAAISFFLVFFSAPRGYSAEIRGDFPDMVTKGPSANVHAYGAKGDGVTDDTVAIQAAVNAAAKLGGTVYFPTPARYKVSSQINVSSYFPINLISNMGAPVSTAPYGSYIRIGADIAGSVFKYSVPSARGTSGGGNIRGLSFVDDTSIATGYGLQGIYAITACLELTDFNLSTVENCYFHFVKGSAIRTQSSIQSQFRSLVIRYCGDTGKPAIYLNGDPRGAHVTQALVIADSVLEVNYGAPYIFINRYSGDIKVSNCQFETETSVTAANQQFIYQNGTKVLISNCGFNRNNETSVYIDTYGETGMDNCTFESSPARSPKLDIVSQGVRVANTSFKGIEKGTSIRVRNGYALFTNCRVYSGGNVILGTQSTWTGGTIEYLTTAEPYALIADSHSTVSGVRINNNPTGGLKLTGLSPSAIGNKISNCAGIGLRSEADGATVVGNRVETNRGGDASFSRGTKGYTANANVFADGNYPQQTSIIWDPGLLPNGASETKLLSYAYAGVGDFVIVSFPCLVKGANQNGMQISGFVPAAGQVNVTISNLSGISVDLDSGILTIQILKKN